MTHELWKPLDAGEIVQAGDQYDACSDPWRCDPIWVEVHEGSPLIGSTVPDPAFPAHTRYRRRFNDDEQPVDGSSTGRVSDATTKH